MLTMYLMALAQVSIHAPTRGATRKTVKPVVRHGFNSRAHEGRDRCSSRGAAFGRVSIHAPTRGATGDAVPARFVRGVSIHAPTRGATLTENP